MFGPLALNEDIAAQEFHIHTPRGHVGPDYSEEDGSALLEQDVVQPESGRRSVRAVAFVAVFLFAALAIGLLSMPRGSNPNLSVRGVVQLGPKGQISTMYEARAKMQENINKVVKKMEPMQRKNRPERLTQMRQRMKTARAKLQTNTDALRQSQVEKKLAKIAPAQAAVLLETRANLQKGQSKMRATTGSLPASRAFAPQERRALLEARGTMMTNVGKLTKKMDQFKRGDRPNRLHGMRQRLQSAQAKLQMHKEKLARNGEL